MRAAIVLELAVLCAVAAGCGDHVSLGSDPEVRDGAVRDGAVHPGSGGSPATMSRDAATSDAQEPDRKLPAFCYLPQMSGPCDALFRAYYYDSMSRACREFTYGGCQGNENNFPTLAACEDACDVMPRSNPCSVDATDPSLPGVSVHIEGDRCVVETGQTHLFSYVVQVDQDIAYTAVDSGGACGSCMGALEGTPDSLVDFAIGDGADITFCNCDVGCCPPTTVHAVTLKAGTAASVIEWPGRQWHGPSDTNVPYGEPFPAGSYSVSVTFEVPGKGKVVADLPIQVTAATSSDPSAAACKVGRLMYRSGSARVPDPTSCNTCTCDDGKLTACTEINCPKPCPADTVLSMSCASCGPTDECEVVELGCLPTCTQGGDECAGSGGTCVSGICRNVCG